MYIVVRRVWQHGHTDIIVSRKRLSYTVGTKLQVVEVALKNHNTRNFTGKWSTVHFKLSRLLFRVLLEASVEDTQGIRKQ